MEENLENILRELECPVCNEYMHFMIPMCVRGHSICSKCKQKCQCCPVCKSSFGDSRNYTLEKLIVAIKIPCKNKKDGCLKVANPVAIRNHMEDCELGDFPCLLKNILLCQWKGKLGEMKKHLDVRHFHLNITYTNDISANIAVISVLKSMFKVNRKYVIETGFVYWAVQYIGAKNKAKNYRFRVEFTDKSDSGCNLSLSADCISMCDDREAFDKNHVKVHIDMLNISVSPHAPVWRKALLRLRRNPTGRPVRNCSVTDSVRYQSGCDWSSSVAVVELIFSTQSYLEPVGLPGRPFNFGSRRSFSSTVVPIPLTTVIST
ncbi:seven in absentia [Carabus blaptoides fortunei]